MNQSPRLNILQIVSSSATSGAERHTVELSNRLAALGHQVAVICPPIDWMVDELTAAGVTAHAISLKDRSGFPAMREVMRIVRAGQFDVIHAHLSRAAYLGLVSGTLHGVPLVCTVHVATKEPIYKVIARRSNRLVAVSSFIRGVLHGRGIKEKYIDVVHNGTDFAQRSYDTTTGVKEEFQLPEEHRLIGLVGRVAPEKGHQIAVNALPGVLDKEPNAHLMFVGRLDGEFPELLRKQVRSMNLETRVTFSGNRDDVARLIDALEFSILPSSMESFGLAVIESMARSKPVVVSRVGGLQEVVAHEETGLVVDQSPEAFEAGMSYLLTDDEARLRMGRNARAVIDEKFSMRQMVERLEAVYMKAAGRADDAVSGR